MKNLWSDNDARAYVRRHAKDGVSEDVALRVFTPRLLRGDLRRVIHGGGNIVAALRQALNRRTSNKGTSDAIGKSIYGDDGSVRHEYSNNE